MPGVTPLGLRYPYEGEPVTATSWQNLAEDIDAMMTNLNTTRNLAMRRTTAHMFTTGGLVTATGVDSVMTFNQSLWDSDGIVSFPSTMNLPPGVWWARVTSESVSGFATFTFGRVGVLTPGPTLWAHMQVDTVTTSLPGPITASGCLVTTAVTPMTMRVRWNGTGGPATWGASSMQVYKVRDLGDA